MAEVFFINCAVRISVLMGGGSFALFMVRSPSGRHIGDVPIVSLACAKNEIPPQFCVGDNPTALSDAPEKQSRDPSPGPLELFEG